MGDMVLGLFRMVIRTFVLLVMISIIMIMLAIMAPNAVRVIRPVSLHPIHIPSVRLPGLFLAPQETAILVICLLGALLIVIMMVAVMLLRATRPRRRQSASSLPLTVPVSPPSLDLTIARERKERFDCLWTQLDRVEARIMSLETRLMRGAEID